MPFVHPAEPLEIAALDWVLRDLVDLGAHERPTGCPVRQASLAAVVGLISVVTGGLALPASAAPPHR